MRLAVSTDRDAIMAFLMARPAIAMLPVCNLRDYGMQGGHPKAMTFWLDAKGGRITDVLGLSDAGFVMPVFTSADVPDVMPILRGRKIVGILGQAAPVAAIKVMLRLPQGALDRQEPHLELALAQLCMPETQGATIKPITRELRDKVIAWRAAYGIETLELSPQEAAMQAVGAVDAMIAGDTHRVLVRNDKPLAMTGFNAQLPEIVMVGGVYTPAEFRGRGYARAALALHLIEAQKRGVARAVLSAANGAAISAYQALGFKDVGKFMIVFYNTPQVAHG